MPQVQLIPGPSLTAEQARIWMAIQDSEETFQNPFLGPGFVRAVSQVRDDVEVAVLCDSDVPVGFFPFQRRRGNVGCPVGGHLSNLQAVVTVKGTPWDAGELLRGCLGLTCWNFDNLLASQTAFQRAHHMVEPCRYLDFSRGYAAYLQELLVRNPRSHHGYLRKRRKMERDLGKVRFEGHTTDKAVFRSLLRWKDEQCRLKRTFNLFGFDWTIALLEHILEHPSSNCAARLSVLYAADEPVAACYALSSKTAADAWLIAYNAAFSKYSPGMINMLETAEHLACSGIRRFYLGRGETAFKQWLTTKSIPVAEGSLDRVLLRGALKRSWAATLKMLRASRLREPARCVKRWLEPIAAARLTYSPQGRQASTSVNKQPESVGL